MRPALAAIFLAACTRAPEPKPTLEIADGGSQVSASVRARPNDGVVSEADGRKHLSLAVVDASTPIVGTYAQQGSMLVFRPAALVPGEHYRATLHLADGDITRDLALPALPPEPAPTIEWVRPLAKEVPQNHLRFYVRFSRPMREGSLEGIALVSDATHAAIPLAFQKREIWSPDRMTLTLLFHPGRQKRDIGFGEGIGPVLQSGVSYSIVITQCEDDRGTKMQVDYTHHFRATDADRTLPDARRFTVRAPSANTLDAAVVSFGEPLDPLVTRERTTLAGTRADFGDDDSSVRLIPTAPWKAGTFVIDVDALEDFAGNTPQRLFDHAIDVQAKEPARVTFVIR